MNPGTHPCRFFLSPSFPLQPFQINQPVVVILEKYPPVNISLCKEDLVRLVARAKVGQHLPVDVHLLHCPHVNLDKPSFLTNICFIYWWQFLVTLSGTAVYLIGKNGKTQTTVFDLLNLFKDNFQGERDLPPNPLETNYLKIVQMRCSDQKDLPAA